MLGISHENFKYIILQINDGAIFEEFIKPYLSQILGYDFIPSGNMHDKGIDGLFKRGDEEKHIYQISIEANWHSKLKKTLEALKKNKLIFKACFW